VVSVTQVRKDRERAAREELILEHARRMLVRDGFQNLNLDELAKAIEYSKGTIYLHFETKEDLALGVVTRTLKERADLFERASKFEGNSREKARAIGFACCQFAVMHRDHFNIELMLRSASFWEKSSPERRRLHGIQASRAFHIMNNIVLEAQRVGDLSAEVLAPQVTLSLISITLGTHIVSMQPDLQMLAGVEDPICLVRQYQDLICDAWGWKPLLKEFDHKATDRRIKAEIFPEAAWFKG
jgi:AcrR family transcriptional regulator